MLMDVPRSPPDEALMSQRRLFNREPLLSALAVALASAAAAHGQDKDPTLEAMQQRMAEVKAGFADRQDSAPGLQRNKTPLLRFSDPAREGFDGTLWLWISNARPVALLSLTRYPDFWNYEHISFSERPLEFSGREGWKWTSQGKPGAWLQRNDPVAETSKQRIIQMRSVSRQYRAVEHYQGQQYELRMLSRPVYLYSDPGASVLDGGLFVLTHDTNPEIVMSVESRRTDSGATAWFVTFTRTAAADLTVYQGDQEVWKASMVLQWDPHEEYYGHTVPIPAVDSGK